MSPITQETLDKIGGRIEEAKGRIASLEDVLSDMRSSGINALEQEERLRALKEDLRKWQTFHELQSQRGQPE